MFLFIQFWGHSYMHIALDKKQNISPPLNTKLSLISQ